jgi:hypothetical protein
MRRDSSSLQAQSSPRESSRSQAQGLAQRQVSPPSREVPMTAPQNRFTPQSQAPTFTPRSYSAPQYSMPQTRSYNVPQYSMPQTRNYQPAPSFSRPSPSPTFSAPSQSFSRSPSFSSGSSDFRGGGGGGHGRGR